MAIESHVLNRVVEKCYANGFFFFFSYQIFSPQIGGRTIYLEYLFILLNPFFWQWIWGLRLKNRTLLTVVAGVVLVPFHTVAAVKLTVIAIGVMFLVYCFERRVFYLHWYIIVSVLVGLVQFSFLIAGHSELATQLGPRHLSSLVWGPYATQTFANFYVIFALPRVSGLSREGGFFASFLIGGLIAWFINRRLRGQPYTLIGPGVYLTGLMISISKISAAIVPAVILVALRRVFDKLPLIFIAAAFLGVLVAFWNYFQFYLFLSGNGTFLGRFGAYALIDNLSFSQLMLGAEQLSDIHSPLTSLIVSFGYTELFGLGGWVIKNGAIALFLYTIALRGLGIRGAGFLFVLLMTATVGIDTNQNFCVLAYYVAFMLPKVRDFFGNDRKQDIERSDS